MPMDEDEEEYFNYDCPTGKLIKKLEEKSKKCVIDNSLSQILDEFNAITSVQDRYLVNGIFQIDFAQSALFIQSSSIYYAKRVDKLWDELLELHTRLVQYDHNHAKEIKDSTKLAAKENELHKIEDRINRNRRKKIQLVDKESHRPPASSNISDLLQEFFGRDFKDGEDKKGGSNEPSFETDEDLMKTWSCILNPPPKRKKVTKAVWEHGHQTYKLKNYEIYGKDFLILDLDDKEEFGVKYSNAPTFHHIKHLFEYNDRCLLPDYENTIANLRLAYSGTNKYMTENHIPFGTPYEVYKEGYEQYIKDFYDREKRRIQNLPQKNEEDLHNFYKILMHREREALQAKSERMKSLTSEQRMIDPGVTFESLIEAPLCDSELRMIRPAFESECSDAEVTGLLEGRNDQNPADRSHSEALTVDRSVHSATSGFFSNDEENVQLNSTNQTPAIPESAVVTGAPECEPAQNEGQDPNNNPEEGSNEVTNKQFRADSGFFDTGFETDDEDDGDDHAESSLNLTPSDNNKDLPNENNSIANDKGDATADMAAECQDVSAALESEENEENNQNKMNTTMVTAKRKTLEKTKKEEMKKSKRKPVKRSKEVVDIEDDDIPKKRRKLTLKAIEILSKSLVTPVNEMKWEKFFSVTYLPELGEGTVEPVEYESEPEPAPELEHVSPMPEIDEPQDGNRGGGGEGEVGPSAVPPPPSDAYHSDHDYVTLPSPARSDCHSEHDYALPPPCEHCHQVGGNMCEKCKLDGVGANPSLFSDKPQENKEGERSRSERDAGIDEFVRRVESEWDDIIRNEAETPLQLNEYGPLNKAEQEAKDYEEERAKSRKRVDEWKQRIIPILKKKQSQKFDIHEYGSKIIDGLEMQQTTSFSHFVVGKQPAEVARYFVSVLQLANTNNIEIGGAKKGQFSNDSFTLKLLNKERYHEHLNEFMAPSEETFRERLERVRTMNKRTPATTMKKTPVSKSKIRLTPPDSTPTHPPLKKLKIVLNCPPQTSTPRRLNFDQSLIVQTSPVKRNVTQLQNTEQSSKRLRIVLNRTDLEPPETSGRFSSQDSGIDLYDSPTNFSQASTSRGIPGVDFEVMPQQMGPPQPIFADVMSWKMSRMQRRRSSTSDSGIMRSPTYGVLQSPVSEEAFRQNLRVSLDSGTESKQSTPQKDY